MPLVLNQHNKLVSYKSSIVYYTDDGGVTPFDIYSEQTLDLEINWCIDELFTHGSLVFHDILNYNEHIPLTNKMRLLIKAADIFGGTFEQTFCITSFSSTIPDNSTKIGKILFVDETYYQLSNLYKSKGFKDKSISDIFKDYMSEIKPNVVAVKPIQVEDIPYKIPYYTTNQNYPVIKTLYDRMYIDGFMYFQNRLKQYFIPSDKILNFCTDLTSILVFGVWSPTSPESKLPIAIQDFSIGQNNKDMTNAITPDTSLITFNYLDKKPIKIDYDIKTANDDMKIMTSSTKELIGTTGRKYIQIPYTDGSEKPGFGSRIFGFKLLENNKIDILVNGSFMNEVYTKVALNMQSLNVFSYKYNQATSGKYIVYKITDKITQGNFTQKITLAKPTGMI